MAEKLKDIWRRLGMLSRDQINIETSMVLEAQDCRKRRCGRGVGLVPYFISTLDLAYAALYELD